MDDNVTIVVDSNKYEVSKKKLIEESPYFNAMFNSHFLERHKTSINIKGIDCDAWEEILHYVETGNMRPKPFNSIVHRDILKILVTSDMLMFHAIRELCLESLVEILAPKNSLEIFEVASKLEIPTLMQKSRAVALWNADIIIKTEVFGNLDVEQVEDYLSDPGLHSVNGEWGVWEAVNRWIVSDSDPENSREKYLPRLIKCLSLRYLTLPNLRTLSVHERVRSNPTVSAVLRSITGGLVKAPKVYEFIDVWRSRPPRRLPLVPAVVAQVRDGSSDTVPCIVRFSSREGKFIPFLRLGEADTNLNSLVGFKVISSGSKLYLLGGEIRNVSWYLAVWEYDLILRKWNFLSNLRKETRHAAACVLGTYLFVIGGLDRCRIEQDTVSKLCLHEKKWTTCSPLPRPTYAAACCTFRGKIYVIKTEIHEYNPVLDMWELLDISLPKNDVCCVAMANEDYIFISGLQKSVYKFDPTQREPRLVHVGSFVADCTQACLLNSCIYNVSEAYYGSFLLCEVLHIRSGLRDVVWRVAARREIYNFSPNNRHGCFPLLLY